MAQASAAGSASYPLRLWRLLRLGVHIAEAAATIFLLFPRLGSAARDRLTLCWTRRFLALLNVRLSVQGDWPSGARGALLVLNHVSWLDVFLLLSQRPVRFIAKAEVRAWPLFGWLAKRQNTLFIERSRRRDTARINQELSAALVGGDWVALFAEGTTTDGASLRHFHSSLLEPAAGGDAVLLPLALRYLNLDGSPDTRPAYCGDMTLGQSLRRILACRRIDAELIICQPLAPGEANRRLLAQQAHAAIAAALQSAKPPSL
ncbi:MAG: lysophospholipid acyltransferase family protein [Burkholderiales bacterium]